VGDTLVLRFLPDDAVMTKYHLFHDVVTNTPRDASTRHSQGWSHLRVRTTTAITNGDKDVSPDFDRNG